MHRSLWEKGILSDSKRTTSIHYNAHSHPIPPPNLLPTSIPLPSSAFQVHGFKGFAGGLRDIRCHPTEPLVASAGLDRYLRVHNFVNHKIVNKIYLKSRLNQCLFKTILNEGLALEEEEEKEERREEEGMAKGGMEEEGKGEEEDDVWDAMETVGKKDTNKDGQKDGLKDAKDGKEEVKTGQKTGQKTAVKAKKTETRKRSRDSEEEEEEEVEEKEGERRKATVTIVDEGEKNAKKRQKTREVTSK